ncbi:uncharacterized protein XM38_050260 [Halomicronema hongdechloris C2206]|uniref:DUF928 domain-containing protein n=1 Tax=Halomicronema hongdechloris C2206 TaxID=1641165 RepID=A0A1Z3HUV7_9CYAN|nr:DUF928 domain-containing protein [Halomicronema hongdechloris]ASC74052.1 uncharacterized protein XM38_050260 [Halomicronema hongdechloris C2206]
MPTPTFRRRLVRRLVPLVLAVPIMAAIAPQAEAGLIERIQSIFGGGNTGGQVSNGRSRGGAIRREVCGQPVAGTSELGSTSESQQPNQGASQASAADVTTEPSSNMLVVLSPPTRQKTTQARPSFYLYVPYGQSAENIRLFFELSQINPEVPVPHAPRTIANLPLQLPETPGWVRFQVPEEIALEVGKTYAWNFNIQCVASESATATASAETVSEPESTSEPLDDSVDSSVDSNSAGFPIITSLPANSSGTSAQPSGQEDTLSVTADNSLETDGIWGQVERIEMPPRLMVRLDELAAREYFPVYLEYELWFEMVSNLATFQPPEWQELLANYEALLPSPAASDTTTADAEAVTTDTDTASPAESSEISAITADSEIELQVIRPLESLPIE